MAVDGSGSAVSAQWWASSGGDVVEAIGVEVLEGHGGLAVEAGSAGGGELLLQGGPDQGVGEAVAVDAVVEDEVGGGRLVERVEHVIDGEVCDPGHQLDLEVVPDDRRPSTARGRSSLTGG